jgi:hypothetical protein
MILLSGLSYLTSQVAADMTTGQAGTDTTLFDKSQTGLQTAVAASAVALIDKTSTTSQVSVTHQLSTSTANGNTLVEWEVNNGSTSYNRAVKAAIVKSTLLEVTVVHTFDFEIVV